MGVQSQSPTTFIVWNQALVVMRAQKGLLSKVALASFFLPYIAAVLVFALKGDEAVRAILGQEGAHYLAYLYPAYGFLLLYLFAGLAFLCLSTAGFLACVCIVSSYYQGEKVDFSQAMRRGLRLAFPGGLVLLLVTAVVSLERFFLGPFRLLTMFVLMAAVIMVVDKRGSLGAIKQALFFKYSSPLHGGSFSAAFVLMGLSALVFAGEYSLHLICEFLSSGDSYLSLSRSVWTVPLPGLPFSLMHFLTSIIYGLGGSLLLVLVASFLVSLFFSVRSRILHIV